MSLGRMNCFIDIVSIVPVTIDSEGFGTKDETILASVRAYKEERRGSERWANLAAFSEATALFRFRVIPEITVTEALTIVNDGKRYRITDVQYGRGRGMYVECLCTSVEGSVA